MSVTDYSQIGLSEEISPQGVVAFRIGCLICREVLPWTWASWQADLGQLNRIADKHWREQHEGGEQR